MPSVVAVKCLPSIILPICRIGAPIFVGQRGMLTFGTSRGINPIPERCTLVLNNDSVVRRLISSALYNVRSNLASAWSCSVRCPCSMSKP